MLTIAAMAKLVSKLWPHREPPACLLRRTRAQGVEGTSSSRRLSRPKMTQALGCTSGRRSTAARALLLPWRPERNILRSRDGQAVAEQQALVAPTPPSGSLQRFASRSA
eukprot:9168909-Alexandrium_andersonii.AAC.1